MSFREIMVDSHGYKSMSYMEMLKAIDEIKMSVKAGGKANANELIDLIWNLVESVNEIKEKLG